MDALQQYTDQLKEFTGYEIEGHWVTSDNKPACPNCAAGAQFTFSTDIQGRRNAFAFNAPKEDLTRVKFVEFYGLCARKVFSDWERVQCCKS